MPLGLLRRSTSSLPLVLDTTFQLIFTGMNVVGALHLLDRLTHCSYAAFSACSIAASDYLRRPCGDQATYVLPPTAWSPPSTHGLLHAVGIFVAYFEYRRRVSTGNLHDHFWSMQT
jgi:hypothetical protein